MTGQVPLAFEPEGQVIPMAQLLPLRTLAKGTRSSSRYLRIAASIEHIGIIEPIVVYPQNGRGAKSLYLILDGHLRYDILQQRGETEVFCLIATDDDSFTYNHKVNQISPIQEHFMIMRALESGVSEERIAATLHVDVSAIRKKRDLLDGVCPEAVHLLKDKRATAAAIRELRRVHPLRQIEMAELMTAANNFTTDYAKCLVAATPPDQLSDPPQNGAHDAPRPEDIQRIEREMQTLEQDFRAIDQSYAKNMLDLVLAAGYVRRLLGNAAVARYLGRHHPDICAEFEKLSEANDLRAEGPPE